MRSPLWETPSMESPQILGHAAVACLKMPNEKPADTAQRYVKVALCLYRDAKTGRYWARKKVKGRHKERSLDTTDRKIAERRLKEWLANLEKVDTEVEKMTLKQLIERFDAVTAALVENTQTTNRAIKKHFLDWWPHGSDYQVRNVRPSQLDEWLAVQEQRGIRNTTYNRYAGFLKQLFEIAVKDRIIPESPCKHLKTPWKRPQAPIRHVPTVEQFEAIVQCARSQPFTDHAEDSADFLAFLGLAGLGQAEASALTWGDVDLDWKDGRGRIRVHRQKTDTPFYIPIYAHLRPLLEKLKKKPGLKYANKRVLKINDAKKALKTACEKLGYHPFSQRNLRQCLIRRLWQAGVDVKLIAMWQGHRDGGRLILDTYTELFGANDDLYEQQQLAKVAPASKPNREFCA